MNASPNIIKHVKTEIVKTSCNNAIFLVGWAFDDGSFNYDVITSMTPDFKRFCKVNGLNMNPDGEFDLPCDAIEAALSNAKQRLAEAEERFTA